MAKKLSNSDFSWTLIPKIKKCFYSFHANVTFHISVAQWNNIHHSGRLPFDGPFNKYRIKPLKRFHVPLIFTAALTHH